MKKKKMPKKPKQSASLSTWERYAEKVKEVEKHNAQLIADKKKREELIKKTRALKSKHRVKGKLPSAKSSLDTWKNAYERISQAAKDEQKKATIQKKFR